MKALKIIAAVLVVLIVGVLIFVATFDISQYKGMAEAQAKAATGRDVTIGDISLAVSLTPAVVVTDVVVGNAPWGSRPAMATIGRLEASTQLIPLLSGDIRISGVKIIGADVLLETDAAGKGNWEFETSAEAAPAEGGGSDTALAISGVAAENLKLVYRNRQDGTEAAVAAKTLDVDIDGQVQEMNIGRVVAQDAQVSFKDAKTTGEASVGSLDMRAAGPITALNITHLELENAKGAYKGDGMAAEGAAGRALMDAKGPITAMNISRLELRDAQGSFKDASMAAGGTVGTLTLAASGPLTAYAITNIEASNTQFSYKADGEPMEGKFSRVSLSDNGALNLDGELNGQPVKATGTLASAADLAARNKPIPAKLSLEALGLKGTTDVTVDFAAKPVAVNGSITIDELVIPPSTEPPAERLFPDDPLPWDQLSQAAGQVNLTVARVVLPNQLTLTDIVAPVKLGQGQLAVHPATLKVAGGSVQIDVAMNANDKSLSLKAEAQGMTAENVSRAMKATDVITNGPIDLAVNVRGSGESVRAIMATLDGSLVGGMGESRIRNDALNVMGADVIMQVLNAVNPLANKDPYTIAKCAAVNFQVAKGVARTENGIAMVTDKMVVTSSGTINLGTERIDLSVRPRATGGLGVGLGALTQMAKVSGTLAKPSVGIDQAGAMRTLGSIGAAFATGGGSLLAQGAMDKADAAAGDACAAARTWHQKK